MGAECLYTLNPTRVRSHCEKWGLAASRKPKFDGRVKREGMQKMWAGRSFDNGERDTTRAIRGGGGEGGEQERRVSDPEDKAAGTGSFGWELISLCTCLSEDTLQKQLG